MTVVCSVCEKKIGEKPGHGVSHGLCRKDFLHQMIVNGLATKAEREEFANARPRYV